jgi:hypothetical protein
MNKYISHALVIVTCCLLNTACTSTQPVNNVVESSALDNILLVYEDGRMEYNSRFLNVDDVIIYADGRGGERAAIKVRVPIHSDFYRDSIVVVRVVKQHEESIADSQNDYLNTDHIN